MLSDIYTLSYIRLSTLLQNPQVDIQAMARCHRIGQTKPVAIYRLCTKGTIDEEIIKRADVKRFLEKMVISKQLSTVTFFNKDTLLKLKQIMESKEYKVVTSEKEGEFFTFCIHAYVERINC